MFGEEKNQRNQKQVTRVYFLVKRNSVISEKINPINNNMRYPKNSIAILVARKPIIMMITALHIPAIIRCLLSI